MDLLLPLGLVYDTKNVQVQRPPQFHQFSACMPEMQEIF